jgi:phenylacetate-coenzyme A ligase PaaK-like adenylate-forming protein
MAEPARVSERCGAAAALRERIQGVLLSASYVSDQDRADIGRIWDCRVNEHYAMTETGLCGAVGCTVPASYHLWESGLYYEIIDSDTLLPLPEGCYGELVVTTLTDRGMPFIRYRTGDRSRALPGTCPCGSVLRRIERVQARPVGKKFQRDIPDSMDH